VLAVIADGSSVKQVADKSGVSRQPVQAWLAKYEASCMWCNKTDAAPVQPTQQR